MSCRADKLGDGRTDAGNDNTRRPILASGKKSNFNHGVCLKDIPMKSGMLVAQKQCQISGEISNSYRFIATWSVQQLLASLCRQPAPVRPAMDEIRYNSTGNPWQKWKKLLEMHQNQVNVFESTCMLFHCHWSSQLSTVNDASVWI